MTKDFSTRMAHVGHYRKYSANLVNIPAYRGSTVVFENMADFEARVANRNKRWAMTYGLSGNPATFALEEALCEVEGAQCAQLTNSGLSAVTTALLAFLSAGDHLLMVDSVYDPTRSFCDSILRRMGVEVEYYPPRIAGDITSLIRKNTKVIFLESPGSLTFEVQDTPAIVAVAQQHGVLTMMDNTWSAGVYHRPLELGVDLSIHAATKYQCGHSDVLIGAILTNDHADTLRRGVGDLGQGACGEDAYLTLRGMRTMHLRLHEVSNKALSIARWLEQQAEVKTVLHPALESHPDYALWKRDFSGSSGLFAVQLNTGSKDRIAQFIDELELFAIGASWGGYESLVIPCEPPRDCNTIDVNEGGLVRLQIGLESERDLREDIARALRQSFHE